MNNKLKNRRKEIGLTMKEVADIVGVSEGTISRWESGNIKSMKQDKITAYAKALKVNPRYIIDDNIDEANMIPIRPNLMDKFRKNTSNNNKKMIIVTNKEKQITLALMHDLSDEEVRSINAIIETCAEQIRKRKERK